MNKLLLNKLDTFLDGKSDDWEIDSNPDVETILDDFIKETITSEFMFDKFEVELSDMEIDKLCDYVYNNFDDLYDETDSRIEDELSNRDDTQSPFGPGMGQSDFI